MLKIISIVAVMAAITVMPSVTFAQMENDVTGSDSIAKGSTGEVGGKSAMMKKSKMHHHSMHHTMTKDKSMSSGGM